MIHTVHDRLKKIEGDKFLYLDLDVIIHQDLKYFFDLDMKDLG